MAAATGFRSFARRLLHSGDAILVRESACIAGNTVASSVGGFLFWLLVARYSNPELLGLASAVVVASTLVVNVAVPGFGFGLIRFLPLYDAREGHSLLNRCLTGSVILAGAGVLVFVLGIPLWSPALRVLQENYQMAGVFLLMALGVSIYYIVDQVLIGHQRSDLLLVKNVFVVGARLGLLILFVAVFSGLGDLATIWVLVAYGLPLVAIAAISLGWLLPAARPGYAAAVHPGGAPWSFITYSFGSHIYEMLHNVPSMVLPLLVVNLLGLQPAGSFYIAWTVAIGLSAVPTAAGYALFAHGSRVNGGVPGGGLRFVLGNLGLSAFVAGGAWVAGPWLLELYGRGYIDAGELLRLLVISIVLVALNSVYVARLRITGRLRLMLLAQVVTIGTTMGASLLLLPRLQLMGIGWAWLAAQFATAVLLTVCGGSQVFRVSRSQPGSK